MGFTILPGKYGIVYEELQFDSPKEQISTLESQVIRKFKIDWSDREHFIEDLLGGEPFAAFGAPGLGVPGIQRRVPHGFPDFSYGLEDVWLWCRRIMGTEGVGPRGKEPNNLIPIATKDVSGYVKCIVTAMYESVTWNMGTDDNIAIPGAEILADEGGLAASGWTNSRYVTFDPVPLERVFVFSRGMMRIVNDNVVIDFFGNQTIPGGPNVMDGVPITCPDWELNYRWHEVPAKNWPQTAIGTCMGQVNDDEFDGWPKGTLLCKAPRIRIYRGQLGTRLMDISYKFLYRPNFDQLANAFGGWNTVPWVDGGKLRYYGVSTTGTSAGDRPHRYVDFKTLFRPE